ncbi:MAG: cbb3-type cytochrome c oxidase subunit I [Thermodesulfobacteriota bacterium]
MEKRYSYNWFVLAILFLGIGGGFAFMVGMSRTPFGYQYFPADYLHRTLVGHVVLAILLWLLSFAVVLWSRTFDGVEIKATRWLALGGAFLIILAVLFGGGKAVINNYVPTIDTPLFLLGLALFYLAFSLNVFAYLREALRNLFSIDLMKGAIASSVLIALIMVVSMAISIFLQDENTAPILYYERLFWIPGHIQQVLSGALFVAVLYALRDRISGSVPSSWPFLRYVTIAFPLSALLLFIIPFTGDPLTRNAKITAEAIYGLGLGIPIFIHIIHILRTMGLGSGRRTSVAFISLILSVTIYTLGMAIAYSGFGDDLRVPAHYHGAVTSLTLALMGLSYYMLKERKERIFGETIARVQPVIYGAGMVFFIVGLFVSGLFGAPRKTYGVSFTSDPIVLTALTVMGIGTLLAVIGGILFVFYTGISLCKEEKTSVTSNT